LGETVNLSTPEFKAPFHDSEEQIAAAAQSAQDHLIYGFDGRDQRSRPFNLLRSQILRAAASHNWRLIGVTSPTPKVGKSFVASNLAAALSRTPDLKTILVDFDLRRSTIKENFGLTGNFGIADYLDHGVSDLDGIAQTVPGQELTIIPSFPYDKSSAELLASPRLDTFVQSVRDMPGECICICDLPPVFANDDAMIVAQKIDAFFLVVEDGSTTARQVRESLHLLRPLPCIGTVLNRFHGALLGDSYGYGYGQQGKYADYYSR
jgi:Mrp family chromosome partitioning ATPase